MALRVMLASARASTDPGLLARAWSRAELLHERVGALLVAAVAYRHGKDPQRAAELLDRALLLAKPEGLLRPFIDGGAAVHSALTGSVLAGSTCSSFAERISGHLDSRLSVGVSPAGDSGVPLSDKERAVLRFPPPQMTNEEIGQALYMSVNTVKTHLRSAYRKLGARSRRDAIARARQRGDLVF